MRGARHQRMPPFISRSAPAGARFRESARADGVASARCRFWWPGHVRAARGLSRIDCRQAKTGCRLRTWYESAVS
jgi:hypothetical protein